MKTRLLALCALPLALTGCATSRITVTTPDGLTVRASFPKNLTAENLDLTLDGIGHLRADRITTDASSVIDAQANAAGQLTDALGSAAGL